MHSSTDTLYIKKVSSLSINPAGKMSGQVNSAVEDFGEDKKNLWEKERQSKKSNYPRKQSRGPTNIIVKGTIPKQREDVIKWYGWGYKDSEFVLKDGLLTFSGNRYPVCSQHLPHFLNYLRDKLGIYVTGDMAKGEDLVLPQDHEYPDSRLTTDMMNSFKELGVDVSIRNVDRFLRSQGQGTDDVLRIKERYLKRIPDGVIWPTCHEDVEQIVKLANELNVALIPFGGGTSVAGCIECPVGEQRPILSLDTTQMNEILWIDKESLVVCAESGIIGQDFERELNKVGFTVGHEPDSIEFSTLGGWVSTRASGMKKNTYGNIEDLLVHVRMVTPRGTLQKSSRAPRVSSGPDFNHIVLGSEGCFGVITEVCLKIRPLPPFQLYGSLVFPDFYTGIDFMRELAKNRLQPPSVRLLDNEQFQLGMALRGPATAWDSFLEGLKLAFVEKIKGFDRNKMCMTTLLYEGEKANVLEHQRKVNALAIKHKGIPAGSNNGKRGYMMTFLVGYIRDIAVEFKVIAESFETSVPWDRAADTVRMVRQRIQREALRMGLLRSVVMFRIAQTYDAGCCVYIYYAISVPPTMTMMQTIEHFQQVVRTDLINKGCSLSHHHGVGKTRRDWYETFVSPTGYGLLQAAKAHMDPNNIFASGNIAKKWELPSSKL